MLINARVDNSRLVRRAQRAIGRTPAAEHLVLEERVREFVGLVLRNAPRDTQRYVRGWVQAGNAVGAGFALPKVQRSRHADRLVVRLEQQLADVLRKVEAAERAAKYWEGVYQNRYARLNRRDRWERDCRAKRDKAMKRAAKMQEVAEFASRQIRAFKDGQAGELVIWGRSTRKDTATSRYASVRDKVYGGRGTWKRVGERTLVELKNLEPHASIVEARARVVAGALRGLRSSGVRRISPRAMKLLEG